MLQNIILRNAILYFLFIQRIVISQFRNDTSMYKQTLEANMLNLEKQIESHPDVKFFFDPTSVLIYTNEYIFDYPISANYRIGILIDPCRYNSYNCCMNVFGTAEYPALIKSNLESERVFQYTVIANENDVSSNYVIVDQDSRTIPTTAQRSADDFKIFNTTCTGNKKPFDYCAGRNYAFKRSSLRPPCMDNNSSLNLLDGCIASNGTKYEKCLAVAYSSNAFIPQCREDAGEHCGTFLEIHMAHGTPYQDERDIISQVRIENRNVSGYYTTLLPMTWMKNETKILCSYSESVFRINSLVYVKDTAPVCCCPPPFQTKTRVGSFQCPKGPVDNGAFAYRSQTIADVLAVDTLLLDYPFCPIDLSSDIDRMMCSTYDPKNRRHYTRNCSTVYQYSLINLRSWGSENIKYQYDDKCPYYHSCALTLDLGKCRNPDLRFTFRGRVGLVTKLDNANVVPKAWVSFNNGRTSYEFVQGDLKLETTPKSMYEIWWVVRSNSGFTVQKRKGFNITSPSCTFDTTHNRYYPYAIIKDGIALDNSLTP